MMRITPKIKWTKQIGRRGQSLVEFAISLPLLLMIIVGIAEVGRLFVQQIRAVPLAQSS